MKPEDLALFNKLFDEAPENIGVENSQFGRSLSHLFREMADKGSSTLHAMFVTPFPMEEDKRSENHVMSIELSIKRADGKPIYTLAFYDPNITDDHQRIVAHDLQQVEQWQLEDLIDPDWMDPYYHNTGFSSLLVVPDRGSTKAEGTRTMRFFFDDTKPTPPKVLQQAFCLIFETGLAEAMPALHDRIAAHPERFTVLSAKTHDGWQGLPLAFDMGNAQVVTAFGTMLEQLGKDRRLEAREIAELWAARTLDGWPSFGLACLRDNAEAITAAGAALEKLGQADLLSSDQVFQWLHASTPAGLRCLATAFNWGKAQTVAAAGNMVIRLRQAGVLSSEQAAEVWKANTSNGGTGTDLVSLRGDAEVIAAYESIRKQLEQHA